MGNKILPVHNACTGGCFQYQQKDIKKVNNARWRQKRTQKRSSRRGNGVERLGRTVVCTGEQGRSRGGWKGLRGGHAKMLVTFMREGGTRRRTWPDAAPFLCLSSKRCLGIW
jgi:hypothetical protein